MTIVAAGVVGLLLGVATQVGQSLLPPGLGQLANSIAPWLTAAFLIGSLRDRPRDAAVNGFVALALALVGYYAMVYVRFGYTGGSASLLLWSMGALVGGVVFGVAGSLWRNGSSTQSTLGIALLGSAWLAEAGYLARVLGMVEVAVGYALIGLAIPVALARTARGRLLAWAAMVPMVGLGALGFAALILIYERLPQVV